jgi:hypothetical protein
MSKSPVERMNDLKELELKKNEEKLAKGEEVENTDNSLRVEKKSSYTVSSADKARTNKGAIGIDRDTNQM